MNILKKIILLYQYTYYRLYLYHFKQFYSSKTLALSSSNFALTLNAGSVLFCIDILIEDYTEFKYFQDKTFLFYIIFFALIIVQSIVLRKSIDHYIEKFKNVHKDANWNLKGIAVLFFVYFPMILLIFLM